MAAWAASGIAPTQIEVPLEVLEGTYLEDKELERCYKASRDGWSAPDFLQARRLQGRVRPRRRDHRRRAIRRVQPAWVAFDGRLLELDERIPVRDAEGKAGRKSAREPRRRGGAVRLRERRALLRLQLAHHRRAPERGDGRIHGTWTPRTCGSARQLARRAPSLGGAATSRSTRERPGATGCSEQNTAEARLREIEVYYAPEQKQSGQRVKRYDGTNRRVWVDSKSGHRFDLRAHAGTKGRRLCFNGSRPMRS